MILVSLSIQITKLGFVLHPTETLNRGDDIYREIKPLQTACEQTLAE
jgi:hypothetical protein